MIFCVAYTSTGGAVLQSFAFPVGGIITEIDCGNQASACAISLDGSSAPAAGGVGGGSRALIAVIVSAKQVLLNFPIEQGQLVFIDVKSAGTFTFYVEA